MAESSFFGCSSYRSEQKCKVVDKRIFGLDPVFRSCVKLKVKDMQQLQLVNIPDSSKPDEKIELYTFRDHVINKVEVMGIVVMSDKKERLHSFAVDDATRVILCVQWKPRNASRTQLGQPHLPASLLAKLAEVETTKAAAQDGDLCLGDLVQVRGWVGTFRDQLQVTVLDLRKFENLSVEMEAVLQYPSLYQIYRKPFVPPAAARSLLAGPSGDTFSKLAVQEAICRHIQGSSCSQVTVTPLDISVWPSVVALLPGSQEDPARSDARMDVISAALQSLESGRGQVYRLAGTADTYEIIGADCPMAVQLMTLLKIACQSGKNAEMGCHVLHLKTLLARVPQYSRVDSPVVSYLLSCLETSSDVICVAAERYAPVS